MAQVPFRFKKVFTGYVCDQGKMEYERWIYFAAPFVANCNPDGMRLEKKARLLDKCKSVQVGRSEIICLDAQEYFELGLFELAKDPWFSAKGPPCDRTQIIQLENERVGGRTYDVNLRPNTSMDEVIKALWFLPRDLVSAGIDASIQALVSQVPMTIHEFPTGIECGTQVIPEKWTCLDAYVETLSGNRVFSYADSYLHVTSYSQPFDGTVKRDELLQHLSVHPSIEDAIPYHSLSDRREWGLCCSKKMKNGLNEEFYRVVIRTAFSYSTLKVGEITVRGKSNECIMFCVHLDHPAQVNDGLSGVVVGIDVIRAIKRSANNHYSYLLLIIPDNIGLTAYLNQRKELLNTIKCFVFLDMLGTGYPHLFQLTSNGDSEFERHCIDILNTIKDKDDEVRIAAQATDNENWQTEFNINFPILSILRCKKNVDPADNYLYPEHHTNFDSPEIIDHKKMNGSRDIILELIDKWENRH
jgi:aminopeptidase-like protein